MNRPFVLCMPMEILRLNLFTIAPGNTADGRVTLTKIILKDKYYPFSVTLFYKAYGNENIIEQWTEITHQEKKDVTLYNFFSGQLAFRQASYWLTSFTGNWGTEMNMQEEKLGNGIKVIESKLGVRSNQFGHACFLLGLDSKSEEESGTVVGGTLAWPGSWKLSFEVDVRQTFGCWRESILCFPIHNKTKGSIHDTFLSLYY